MNYDALIKRAEKAISYAASKSDVAKVHKVKDGDLTEKLAGLVVVYHPDYVNSQPNHTVNSP